MSVRANKGGMVPAGYRLMGTGGKNVLPVSTTALRAPPRVVMERARVDVVEIRLIICQ